MEILSKTIAALYVGSDSQFLSSTANPAQILSCLRRAFAGNFRPTWEEVIEALRNENFVKESLLLESIAHREHTSALVKSGKIITLACDTYPVFLAMSMGLNAPPILWISDPSVKACPPWLNDDGTPRISIGGVGCREPLTIGMVIAQQLGLWTSSKTYLGVTGGAAGCDRSYSRAILDAGGEVVNFLPHGINIEARQVEGPSISICAPDEPFSVGRAMERNALIYAMSHMTVVCSARYRVGGSWQGALDALKAYRPVVVADWTLKGLAPDSEYPENSYALAQRGLKNLGAHPLLLSTSSFRTEMPGLLENALEWAHGKLAGHVNTGLFATSQT